MDEKRLDELLGEIKQHGLDDLSAAGRHSANLFDELTREEELPRRVASHYAADARDAANAWAHTRRRLDAARRAEARRLFPRGYLMRYALGGAAAALAFVVLVTALVYRPEAAAPHADATRAGAPDYSRMTLVDDAGRVIELGRAGTVVIDGQGTVAEWKDGLLTFRADAPQAESYRVTVPCGQTMRVALADGSTVRLNALSTLRFPTAFGEQRRVEIAGQAFFEVAADERHPFFVEAGGTEVRVTGTRFDVMAYPDERAVNVTLVEGRVEVSTGMWQGVRLAPSEQASYSPADGQLTLRKVNTQVYTGWTEGLLVFEDRPLEEIMAALARYYDIEPVFADQAARKVPFGFKLPRTPRIDPIIDLFGHIAQVEITRRGRQIMIRSKP